MYALESNQGGRIKRDSRKVREKKDREIWETEETGRVREREREKKKMEKQRRVRKTETRGGEEE